jgi:phage N-6-adenine-methyltransferase
MSYTNTTTPEPERDGWRTPKPIIDWLNRIYQFDYDTACTDENALTAKIWRGRADGDALSCEWIGVLYCNPPYSDVTPWVEKAISSAERGATVVMLIPSPNGEAYHAKALRHAKRLILINGRIAFINADGKPVSGNSRGSCIYVFAPGPDQGCAHLSVIDRDEMYK